MVVADIEPLWFVIDCEFEVIENRRFYRDVSSYLNGNYTEEEVFLWRFLGLRAALLYF